MVPDFSFCEGRDLREGLVPLVLVRDVVLPEPLSRSRVLPKRVTVAANLAAAAT